MNILGIDIGSSSVKAAALSRGRTIGPVTRVEFATRYDGPIVEVPAPRILQAVRQAIDDLGAKGQRADAIGLSVMAPAWCAMDRRGHAITPVITHQDRRSVKIALELERRIGADRHLALVGCRPFPGGISSTTFAWVREHESSVLKRASLVGHLNTLLHAQLTGARVTDPSNASFMGLFNTHDLSGWSAELCDAVGISKNVLPDIRGADVIAGVVSAQGSRRFGLPQGMPVMTGLMDGSAAMLLAGTAAGQVVNTSGSTDVLAVCTNRFRPHANLLTRALGVEGKWVSVSTLAAAGSALAWAREVLFSEMAWADFAKTLRRLARRPIADGVSFDPYLAGERTSIEQRRAAFTGLTLATTREEMLGAVADSIARASAARLDHFKEIGLRLRKLVTVSGGMEAGLANVLRRDWRGSWQFRNEDQATLRGLSMLTPRQ